MAVCGIDFGTSNSAVALPSGEVLALLPSAPDPRLFRSVLFFPEEEREFYTGHAAIERYLEDGAGRFIQSIKSWLPSASFHATQIRNRPYLLEDLVAILLRGLRESASKHTGTELTEVVLGRPAVFSTDAEADALAEKRLRKAAETAGFTEIRFLIEPIAAALAYEAQLDHDEQVLVADFGAGTTDLTLMKLGPERRGRKDRRADVIGSAGVSIGGDKFDAAIMRGKLLPHFGSESSYLQPFSTKRQEIPKHVLAKLLSWHEMSFIRERSTQELIAQMLKTSDQKAQIEALHDLVMDNLGYQLFRAIEAAKIKLSTQEETAFDFEEARISIRETITREEFERFAQPLLESLQACVDGLLATAPLESIDAVFLTGGSSQIPAVRELFVKKFGAGRVRTADAFTSVAEGLGRAAGAR
jgi:hypothetical chaperone protein